MTSSSVPLGATATHAARPTPAAIALNRFGLGVRLEESLPAKPAAWLHAQVDMSPADVVPTVWRRQPGAQPDTRTLAEQMGERQLALADSRREQKQASERQGAAMSAGPAASGIAPDADALTALRKTYNDDIAATYRAAADARLTGALTAPAPFIERLVYFWSNHFALSVEKPQVRMLAGAFENDAVRPHVLGNFEDMLLAVEQHPAMEYYLDQAGSIGPDSMAARRAEARNADRHPGLNENLARETMELHTLGARTGYTQQDVTAFAQALTGWSIAGVQAKRLPAAPPPGDFVFRPQTHEPGARVVMGRTYPDIAGPQGVQQGMAILHDFARSPATAQHIARKLAVHFVSDDPPPALIGRLADTFLKSAGHLPAVYRVLIDSKEAWVPLNRKFKTPWEWTVSAARGLGWNSAEENRTAALLRQLGQPIWQPGSPAGFDDQAASWAAPDALVRRVDYAQRLAAMVGDRIDARTLAPHLLAGSLSSETALEVGRAESASTAIALLLVSPDFLRR